MGIMSGRSLPVLTAQDVGRILGEYRPRPKDPEKEPDTSPLTAKSVSQYLVESKPGGRFANHPFPAPAGRIGQWPYWLPEQESEIRDWAVSRPGAGARTDLPRKKTD
jgi:hypothetical protein